MIRRPPAPEASSPRAARDEVPRRRLRRAVLVAGLVASLAVVADGLLTIAWQEPVTAALQSRAQAGLRDDLSHLEHSFAAHDARLIAAQRRQRQAARAARLERDAVAMLHAQPDGAAIGRIEIPQIDLDAVVVESTGHDALARGPGHYRGTALPGMPGTVGIAGHRTTYGAPFRHLDALRPGSRITVQMPYGRFAYRVTGTKITTPDDASSLRAKAGAPRLVLTACHPLYSAAQRIVVTARQVAPVPR